MAKEPKPIELDYRRYGDNLPDHVREIIATHMAIEAEDAKKAGAVGFMARALVMATMPYKDPKSDVYTRKNGDFSLRIVAGYEGGIPYGIYPRLLMSWVATEVVRTREPVLELGDTLASFLRDVMDIKTATGGRNGTGTRVNEQMRRLFGSLISASYSGGGASDKRFNLRNVLIANEYVEEGDADALWNPQEAGSAGSWKSHVELNQKFFEECLNRPVPIDLRAYKALRGSPLAMDLYTWLTYKMSYTPRRTNIRWEALMMQLGSGYGGGVASAQAVRDFKKAFLSAIQLVLGVYPQAKLELDEHGIVLLPGPTHVQKSLF